MSPRRCEIGEVGLVASGFCTIVLVNDGAAEIKLAPATVVDATDVGVFSVSDLDTVVAPGGTATLRIAAVPTRAGASSATVEVRVVGADGVLASVPASVVGVPPPTCVARMTSLNGVEVGPEVSRMAPMDDVVLTLGDSTVAADRTIASFQWSLVAHPVESGVSLTSTSAVETSFGFGNSPGVDAPGAYTVHATVVDSAGLSDDCELTLTAVPSSALFAGLSWDVPESDIDLHIYRSSDEVCSALDCYALTCGDDGVSWGSPAQSPRFRGDSSSESVTVEAPEDGTYRIAVHARAAAQSTDATLKLFSGGSLLQELSTSVLVGGLWRVVDVDCVGGVCAAREDGSVEALSACAP